MRERSRSRLASAKMLAKGMGIGSAFVLAFTSALLLHSGLLPSRRLACRLISEGLSSPIGGRIEVSSLDSLTLFRLDAREVSIFDPQGELVLHANRLVAQVNLLSIAKSLLFDNSAIRVEIPWVRADTIKVNFRQKEGETLSLVQAFLPKPAPTPVPPPTPPVRPSAKRAFVLDLSAIEIGTVAARGQLLSIGPVDADALTVHGALHLGPDGLAIDTARFAILTRKPTVLESSGTTEFHMRSPGPLWGSFAGFVGGIQVSTTAKLNGSYLDLWGDIPPVDGARLSAFIPGITLNSQVEGKLELHGDLPRLDSSLRIALGSGSLTARGSVNFKPNLQTELDLSIENFDLRTIVSNAPQTAVFVAAHLDAGLNDKAQPFAAIRGVIRDTHILGHYVPEISADVLVDPAGVHGKATVHEEGLPAVATFEVRPDGALEFEANAAVSAIANAPRLKNFAKGRFTANAKGSFAQGHLDTVLSADLFGLSRAGASMKSAKATLHAWGPLTGLSLDASLRGKDLSAGSFRWSKANVLLRGPLSKPYATVELLDDAGPSLKTTASLSLSQSPSAHNVKILVGRSSKNFVVSAETVTIQNSAVDFGGLSIADLGSPVSGFIRLNPLGFEVKLNSESVDLDKLSYILALQDHDIGGKASVDIDLKTNARTASGCVRLDVHDGKFDFLGGLDVSLSARFNGAHVALDSNLALGATGPFAVHIPTHDACPSAVPVRPGSILQGSVRADLDLHGQALDLSSWQNATGSAQFTDGKLSFDSVGRLLDMLGDKAAALAIPKVAGRLGLQAIFARPRGDLPPAISVGITSADFAAEWGPKDARKAVHNLDFTLASSISQSGQFKSSLSLCSRIGPHLEGDDCDPLDDSLLATAAAVSNLDYAALLAHPLELDSILAASYTEAGLNLRDHKISELMAPFQGLPSIGFEAQVGGTLGLRGALRSPSLSMDARIHGFHTNDDLWSLPGALCVQGNYDNVDAKIVAGLLGSSSSSKSCEAFGSALREDIGAEDPLPIPDTMGLVWANARVNWRDIMDAASLSEVPWEANLSGSINGIDLSTFPAFADRNISGLLNLRGSVAGLGKSPTFALNIDVSKLKMGEELSYESGSLGLSSSLNALRGSLDLRGARDESTKDAAQLFAVVTTDKIAWEAGFIPRLLPDHPVLISLRPRKFRLAALLPAAEPVLSYIDGELDGFLNATWGPKDSLPHVREANLVLSHGAFQIPTVGQEFLNASAVIWAERDNHLSIRNFRADSLNGSLDAQAEIDLDDKGFAGLTAVLFTDAKRKIRLTLEGVPLGDVYGRVRASVKRTDQGHEADVELSGIRIDLNDMDLRKIQDLSPNADVVVVPGAEGIRLTQNQDRGRGASLGTGRWDSVLSHRKEKEKTSAPIWKVVFRLTDPARIERTGMRLSIRTRNDALLPTLLYPDPATSRLSIRGEIDVDDGRIDLVGKYFDIVPDRARVSFSGDPSNPDLNVTARWDAPDGTRVYAEVTGPLKDPRLALRSDPARSPSELLTLILLGAGGTTGSDSSSSDKNAAAGVGGGVAAAGINQILGSVTPVNISTRIDTTQTRNLRPTVILEVSRSVSAEASVNTGVVPLGQNPDRYLLTLDWRFLRAWSLRTTVGDAGSSILDLLWQHRY